MILTSKEILILLRLISKINLESQLLWTEDLDFALDCSDFFVPGADAVNIHSIKDIELIEQCYNDLEVKYWTHYLYAVRKINVSPKEEFLKRLCLHDVNLFKGIK